jgi:hypothetical protein
LAVTRGIREDSDPCIFGIVSRCLDVMAQFDEQVQKLHEGNCKLIADLHFERGALATMLANGDSRAARDIKTAERDALQKVLADQILPKLDAIQKTIDAVQERVDAIAQEPKPPPFSCMLRVASKGSKESAGRVDLENVPKTSDGRDRGVEAETTRTLLRYLSEILRQYPSEKTSQERDASLLQTPG